MSDRRPAKSDIGDMREEGNLFGSFKGCVVIKGVQL